MDNFVYLMCMFDECSCSTATDCHVGILSILHRRYTLLSCEWILYQNTLVKQGNLCFYLNFLERIRTELYVLIKATLSLVSVYKLQCICNKKGVYLVCIIKHYFLKLNKNKTYTTVISKDFRRLGSGE